MTARSEWPGAEVVRETVLEVLRFHGPLRFGDVLYNVNRSLHRVDQERPVDRALQVLRKAGKVRRGEQMCWELVR